MVKASTPETLRVPQLFTKQDATLFSIPLSLTPPSFKVEGSFGVEGFRAHGASYLLNLVRCTEKRPPLLSFYYSWNGGRAEAVCAGENE